MGVNRRGLNRRDSGGPGRRGEIGRAARGLEESGREERISERRECEDEDETKGLHAGLPNQKTNDSVLYSSKKKVHRTGRNADECRLNHVLLCSTSLPLSLPKNRPAFRKVQDNTNPWQNSNHE